MCLFCLTTVFEIGMRFCDYDFIFGGFYVFVYFVCVYACSFALFNVVVRFLFYQTTTFVVLYVFMCL